MNRQAYRSRPGRSSSQLCRPEKRQRIYARDGWACLWCGRRHVQLTLDHFLARAAGGDNATGNLLTACSRCNSRRQDRPALTFAAELSGPIVGGPGPVLDRILDALDRPLPRFVP